MRSGCVGMGEGLGLGTTAGAAVISSITSSLQPASPLLSPTWLAPPIPWSCWSLGKGTDLSPSAPSANSHCHHFKSPPHGRACTASRPASPNPGSSTGGRCASSYTPLTLPPFTTGPVRHPGPLLSAQATLQAAGARHHGGRQSRVPHRLLPH